jgi:hypothetical protein
LRLDQIEHQLHGDGRIGGAAARAQYFQAGLDRKRVGGGNHEGLRVGDLAARDPVAASGEAERS